MQLHPPLCTLLGKRLCWLNMFTVLQITSHIIIIYSSFASHSGGRKAHNNCFIHSCRKQLFNPFATHSSSSVHSKHGFSRRHRRRVTTDDFSFSSVAADVAFDLLTLLTTHQPTILAHPKQHTSHLLTPFTGSYAAILSEFHAYPSTVSAAIHPRQPALVNFLSFQHSNTI